MDSSRPSQPITLAELVLKSGISALKVLIPLLWLESRLSPTQFLVAGAALVLATFLFDSSPGPDGPQTDSPSRNAVRMTPANAVEKRA